ncbi:tail fiber domain-containing protein [Limosilactobacillus mucosae]|uniref:tail fiber domain-containing protein n=1 Tax=Limosilactobacillus mucosae TaxID=97478 RepID=UPI00399232AC
MSNTSTSNDKTVGDDAKVKLIIGEIGRDTKTGIIGRGYSFDNGNTFHVTDTIFGRLYDDRDADGIWNNGMHEKVKEKVNQEITNTVEPAIKQADSAVAYANDAIEKSRVNSQAIEDINAALSDAVSDAAVARSDGLRAWNAAQSNVDLIDQNYASASAAISSARTEAIAAADEAKASASAAQADIVAVRSDVAAVQADVTANKSDIAVAKNDIAVVKTDLASQATSLSSYAAQASAAGKDITVLKSQAGQLEQDMADTKGDVSQLKVSASSASAALSDAAGDISNLQASAKSYSAALSDTNSNVATVTATASELETKYADVAGDINQLQTDAKGTTQTLADAQGDIAKLKTRADGFDTEFASTNGDISKLQTDASGTKQTLTNAKSDIAVLQSRADGFDTKYANVAGDINKLQVDASGMKQTLTDAQGNISTLQATATGFKNTLTDAQGNISTLQSDVAGLKKTTSDHAGNIATLQADAKTLTSQMADAQGDISTLQQTASGFSSKVSGMETSLANANSKLNDITSNGGGRNLAIGTGAEYTMGYGIPNTTWKDGYAYLKLPSNTTSSEVLPQGSHTFFHVLTKGTTYTQIIWLETDAKLISSSIQITWFTSAGHDPQPATLINLGENEYKLYSTYMWPGKSDNSVRLFDTFGLDYAFDLSTGTYFKFGKLMLETGAVAHDWSPSPEDTDAKITTNSTAIEQNKKAIALKADQTTVDKANGDVALLKAQLKVQADQIATKVSSSDLPNLVGKGGRNLLTGTSGDWVTKTASGWMNVTTAKSNKTSVADYHTGDKFTYSATVTNKSNTNVRLEMFCCDKNGARIPANGGRVASPAVAPNTTAKRISCTISINDNTWFIEHTLIADGGTSTSKTVQIKGEMFETGAIAHDWSPAPEDTQTYTQTQIKQTADSWNANLTSVKNGLTDKYTNLHATVDGIQAQVYNSDGSSKITQLSNLIATKVSSGDYNSQITQLKNDINLRVAKGNVVSQINQEAGGNTLIQVSGGKGKLALNASSVVFSGSAFIPDAYITTLNADKLRFYDSSGNVATMSAGLEQYDDDKANKTIVLQYSGGYEVHASNLLGSILTMHDNTIRLAVKANGMSSSGSNNQYSGVYVMQHYAQLSNYRSNGSSPGIYITDDGYTIKGDDSGSGTKWGDLNITSPQIYLTGTTKCQINGGNSQVTMANNWSTVHANDDLWLETKNSQIHLGDNVVDIANKNNGDANNYDVHLTLRGYVNMTGWLTCMGLTQTSRLSTKTRIEPLDTAKALELINSADVATYQYKQEVAHGGTKRHASVIIDDVHDVVQYQTPDEFISEDRSGRSDGDIVGYLMGAVQELTKKFKTLESKVG